jgi:hypothetical protein
MCLHKFEHGMQESYTILISVLLQWLTVHKPKKICKCQIDDSYLNFQYSYFNNSIIPGNTFLYNDLQGIV